MNRRQISMALVVSSTIIAGSIIYSTTRPEVPAMTKQNVVCDTGYGVQYFEYKGNLTLRVNHEGRPIRCHE